MNQLDINEILRLLPHRYPFLLIDRVLNYVPGKSMTALKNTTMNELYFMGHFPGNPVMPGVLIIEALAQAMGILAFKTLEHMGAKPRENGIFYFGGIDRVRFKQPVIPGDQLILEVQVLKQKKDIWKARGNVYVKEVLVCCADITAVYKV